MYLNFRLVRLRQFTILGLFLLVTLSAFAFSVAVNRPNCEAKAIVQWSQYSPYQPYAANSQATVVSQHPQDMSARREPVLSDSVIDDALSKASLRSLSTIKRESDPAAWLCSRVKVSQVGDSDLFMFSISGNSYRENTSDFVPILYEIVLAFTENAKEYERRKVLQAPQLIGSSDSKKR